MDLIATSTYMAKTMGHNFAHLLMECIEIEDKSFDQLDMTGGN
jgi:hypothetical protein